MSQVENMPGTKIISIRPEHSLRFWRIATAASVSLALIASYFVVDYRTQLEETRSVLEDMMIKNQQLAESNDLTNQRLDRVEGSLKVLHNPSYTQVVLQGVETSPEALASVFWDQRSSKVFLAIQHLRKLGRDQQYQLWAIVDGVPVDAGIFNSTGELVRMKDVHHAIAFAVTIEPLGGSVSPTLANVQAIGKTGV